MSKVRVIMPDSHGCYADKKAMNAFIKDVKLLDPDEIVMLGDHVDCSGFLSSHGIPAALPDLEYSYAEDIAAANRHLDALIDAAPRAKIHYLEGNHEARIERWACATALGRRIDAESLRREVAPEYLLDLDGRGIRYYRRSEFYGGISIPGTIKLGKCYYTHGISASAQCAQQHLDKFAANVVFGHVHRSVACVTRKVSTGDIGAWSPGCLSLLQPLYNHTNPTGHVHGFAVQMIARSGEFQHIQVTITDGRSLIGSLAERF